MISFLVGAEGFMYSTALPSYSSCEAAARSTDNGLEYQHGEHSYWSETYDFEDNRGEEEKRHDSDDRVINRKRREGEEEEAEESLDL